jgi:transglutaminase-like putative cysteine protease
VNDTAVVGLALAALVAGCRATPPRPIAAPPPTGGVAVGLLGAVPIDVPSAAALTDPDAIVLRVSPAGSFQPQRLSAQLAEWFADAAVDGDDVRVTVARRNAGLTPPRGGTAATFLVDYDEPPVRAATEALRAAAGPTPSVEAITRFVAEYVGHKTMQRGYDCASIIATRREGDCTEHAVLLVALARATGHQARLVHGLLLDAGPAGALAAGHAWAEVAEAGHWRIADATLVPPRDGVRYLPLFAIHNEGPNYLMDIAAAASVERITMVQATR